MEAGPRNDMDALLNLLLPFAQQTLERYGEFYPFGGTISDSGEAGLSASYTGEEHPASAALIELIEAGFARHMTEGDIRACGLCSDVRLQDGRDAIRVEIEHREADLVTCLLPYRKEEEGLVYDELFAVPGERKAFPAG